MAGQVIVLDTHALLWWALDPQHLSERALHVLEGMEREGGNVVELLPVDTNTWLRSLALDWAHSDPADRVIVATALTHNVPLLTKDQVIRDFAGVASIW
jgi:PIN domain nuclease of toxin-antitoxin system